jgi:hypothetical protein
VNDGKYAYVVSVQNVLINGKVLPSPTAWLRADPAAMPVFTENTVFADGIERLSVFAVHGAMPIAACRGGSPS